MLYGITQGAEKYGHCVAEVLPEGESPSTFEEQVSLYKYFLMPRDRSVSGTAISTATANSIPNAGNSCIFLMCLIGIPS